MQSKSAGCGTVDESPKDPACLRISFQGEVAAGKMFLREFGENLMFRLNPEGAAGGWHIEVVPNSSNADSDEEFVWVVTPPFHFGAQRYLDTSYGVSAREAAGNSPREFNFVLDHKRYKEATRLVDLAMSSHASQDKRSQEELAQEGQEATAALQKLPVAKGKLWILDSRAKGCAPKGDSGCMEWIKFKVELRVPCGFGVVVGTRQLSLDSSSCSAPQGGNAS